MPKLSYHFVKNIFYPQILKFKKNNKISCTVYNQSSNEFSGKLKITFISSSTGKVVNEKIVSLKLGAFTSFVVDSMPVLQNTNDQIIYIGTIYDLDGKQLHRNYYLDKKWKHITLPPKKIEMAILKREEKEYVKVASSSFSCFIDLFHPKHTFNERGFILLPGEEIEVEFVNKSNRNINLNKIKCFTLNDYLSEN